MENETHQPDNGVPMPIVKLNRWMLLVGILLALFTGQAWITTLLFLIILPTLLLGQKYSLVAQVGKRMFARQIPGSEREDQKLMRFNNTIAAILLGLAQLAFLAGWHFLGWFLCLMVAVAAGVALAGFCVGCFLYFQFRMLKYRWFNK